MCAVCGDVPSPDMQFFSIIFYRSRITNRPPSDPAHLANVILNATSNLPQYDRNSIVQPQPLVEPLIPEVIDPDDEIVIAPAAPMRSQNCKFLFSLFHFLLLVE